MAVGDVEHGGGEDYAYRLRISAPQPDFAIRVVPSSMALRSKAGAALSVHVIRKDGFAGPIKLGLKDPPEGFTAGPLTVSGAQEVGRLNLRTTLTATPEPITLHVQGSAGSAGGMWSGKAFRRKTGCRPSCGGTWFLPRN